MQLDVLIVSPHPDDAELGMAGAILKFKAEGRSVGILDLTDGEPTPWGSRKSAARKRPPPAQILGIDWRENLGLPNRSLEPTLEARRELAGVFRQTRPRWIFAPYWIDAHPDHVAATQLIEAARFWAKLTKTDLPGEPHYPERIFYYYCVHLRLIPQPAFVLDISDYWDRNCAAIECYRSQFIEGRPQEPPTFIDQLRDRPPPGAGDRRPLWRALRHPRAHRPDHDGRARADDHGRRPCCISFCISRRFPTTRATSAAPASPWGPSFGWFGPWASGSTIAISAGRAWTIGST